VRREIQGRAFFYEAVVERAKAARQAVSDLVSRMFDGSAASLVLSLVEARQLTPEKLVELSAMLDEAERSGEKGDGND
jgi:predicted transcriptional regulator